MQGNGYYRPSDDTFLLAECLQNASGSFAMEIGTGSGYICRLLEKRFAMVVATDIDVNAIKHAKDEIHGVTFVCCDSSSAISNIRFDLIVMNPPYLPSEEILDAAVDGGKEGIEVTVKMINDSIRLLHPNGRMVIVASSVANYMMLAESLRQMGLATSIIGKKKLTFEEIMVLQATFIPRVSRLHQDSSAENPSQP